MKRRLDPEQTKDLCDSYLDGESTVKLGLKFNMQPITVARYLEREGIPRRSRLWVVNHEYFDDIDTQAKAYWLGFLAADGSIRSAHPRAEITISLALKDREHLVLFREHVGASYPIPTRCDKKTGYECVYISIHSRQWTDALGAYTITPKKALTVRWPVLPEHLYHHFFRGYFDGDGSFTFSADGERRNLTFLLASNHTFVGQAQEWLMSVCPVNRTVLRRNGTTAEMAYNGNRQTLRIAAMMYYDAEVCLLRKLHVLKTFLSTHPELVDRYPAEVAVLTGLPMWNCSNIASNS